MDSMQRGAFRYLSIDGPSPSSLIQTAWELECTVTAKQTRALYEKQQVLIIHQPAIFCCWQSQKTVLLRICFLFSFNIRGGGNPFGWRSRTILPITKSKREIQCCVRGWRSSCRRRCFIPDCRHIFREHLPCGGVTMTTRNSKAFLIAILSFLLLFSAVFLSAVTSGWM